MRKYHNSEPAAAFIDKIDTTHRRRSEIQARRKAWQNGLMTSHPARLTGRSCEYADPANPDSEGHYDIIFIEPITALTGKCPLRSCGLLFGGDPTVEPGNAKEGDRQGGAGRDAAQ